MFAMWDSPLTRSWWISVWKAWRICPAVPVKSMTIWLGYTKSTLKPWDCSQFVTLPIATDGTP